MPDDETSTPEEGAVFDDGGDEQPAGDQRADMRELVEMLRSDDVEIELVEDDGLPLASEEEREWPAAPQVASDSAVAELRDELAHVKEIYLRKLAEFDNFRKRTEREREEVRALANESLVRDLVPVLDNFDRALQYAEGADAETLRAGVEMIYGQLRELLQRRGITEVNPVGRSFDPQIHEAVQRVEDTDHPSGEVVDVVAKGYLLSGRLIRPALVAVAVEGSDNGKQGAASSGEEGETVP
jgi:molecular chaperone GrpE